MNKSDFEKYITLVKEEIQAIEGEPYSCYYSELKNPEIDRYFTLIIENQTDTYSGYILVETLESGIVLASLGEDGKKQYWHQNLTFLPYSSIKSITYEY